MGSVITIPLTIALSILTTRILDLDYWLKWLTSFVYIEMLNRFTKKRFDLYDLMSRHDPCKVLFLPPPEETALESPLPENELGNSSDEVFFYGTNSKSESLVVRVSRRPDGESDAWVQLQLSDGRTLELQETSGFQQSGCDTRVFSCGDLQMHYITPMRRWRIFFNGLMKEKKDTNINVSEEKMVHVKFALLWRASADPFDFTADVYPTTLATGISKVKWNSLLPPIEKLKSAMNMYSQTGVILGNVNIEGDEEDHNLYLFGERMRILVHNTLATGMEILHVLGRTTKDGRSVHVVEAFIPNIVDKFRFGFVLQPDGSIKKISNAAIVLESLSIKGKENGMKTKFIVNDNLYEMRGTLFGEQINLQNKGSSNGRITIDHFNFHLNSFEGKGIVIKRKMKKPMKQLMYKQPVQNTTPVVPCVVHFSEKMCQDSEITGGKGSSLGKLTELSKQFQNFIVPNGIVVTTAAYKKFISNEVIEEIKHLETSLSNNRCDDVKAACQRVMDKVIQSTFPESVLKEVITRFKRTFPDDENTLKFAVRSSATGEDTEQMSAAGQMETYLGVTGIDEIMFAAKKCWASQFSHIAVQYKRQNGQVLNSPMAVVIQQMVSCDVAGVVFTCDPLTGNPTRVSITANYGLGESVVSGSEEPDTIELRRNENDQLTIENKMIGSKCRRIVVKDDKGTHVEDIPEKERSICCLTDSMALRLGDLAVKLQKSYRSHRDIEWGYWNNNLYIFQSRPVTSGTGETDFEIDHEHDAPLRAENEYFTVCNVGEVMPGAMSPLGLEVLLKSFGIIFKRPNAVDTEVETRSKYTPAMMCCFQNRVMFNCVDIFKRIDDEAITESTIFALFGRLVEEEDMFELAKLRYGGRKVAWFSNLKENFNRFRQILFTVKKELKNCQNIYSSYRIPIEQYNTAQELFDALMYSCTDLNEIYACHLMCSEASSVWNIIIFSILKNATGELNSNVYTDFAQLLTTSSEVESADVPSSLEDLSSYISEDINPEDFRKMEKDEAVKWLQSSTNKSGVKYREFLHKHGHRCLREFDIHSKTWQTDPSSLIQLLQSTVGCARKERHQHSRDDFDTLISKLKTPLNFKQKLVLKMLIPMSRKGVQDREISKSLLMRGMNAWRKSYTKLSQLMASEGRIPDEDLLFYMNLEEIKELLISRSPRILARANHRRRRQPTLDKYIFPEISRGVPLPINVETHPVTNDDSLTMKGVPVSQGVTTGFVRVAITLEEASLLQAGEILVTYSTDIGWSPYFPLLAGVVTEIGGLISHGAVVSREYGLPCIAGLHGATRQFQTGDYALLDGNKGILQKLPKPENF